MKFIIVVEYSYGVKYKTQGKQADGKVNHGGMDGNGHIRLL